VEKQNLKEIRDDIISRGKRSKKFYKLPRAKKNTSKYLEPDNLEVSGAIGLDDCEVLYDLVQRVKPKVIFEIGTWFGTSAAIMRAAAPEAEIYTCDKNDVSVIDISGIHLWKMTSKKAIKKIMEIGKKVDLVFIDARLMPGDERRLAKMSIKVIAVDDYPGKNKGYRNIQRLKKVLKGKVHTTKSNIAWMEL